MSPELKEEIEYLLKRIPEHMKEINRASLEYHFLLRAIRVFEKILNS